MKKYFLLSVSLLWCSCFVSAQRNELKNGIQQLIEGKKATVGIAISSDSPGDALFINGDTHLPMQSVYKFPIALVVLSMVDEGKFKLDQLVNIRERDLLPGTWSPIREKFPQGTRMSIAELIGFTAGESDNNGCDILLRLVGGAVQVQRFLEARGFADIQVKTTEEEASRDWNVQFQNWATARALHKLLMAAYQNKGNRLLSKASYDFLWKVLAEGQTGMKRIKGDLPAGTWGHKTGTSGMNQGMMAAINDIGVVRLPSGRVIYITVLVSSSKESLAENERIIAMVSKLAYDYYLKRKG